MSRNYIIEKDPKPFLKWAGGKKQVICSIHDILPNEFKKSGIDKYFEPFLGGGAVFFHLINNFKVKQVYLGDINRDLILTYNVIKKRPAKLINELISLKHDFLNDTVHRKKYYEKIRDDFNDDLENFDYCTFSNDHIVRASQMIFLNKTCFNGLYRVNKSGKFNVPMGKYKNPLICDFSNIWSVHKALKNVDNIVCDDFSVFENCIDENSFFYLDPPYLPIKKNSFTAYSSEGFDLNEQRRLSKFCKKIDDESGKFILSNSDPKEYGPHSNFFKENYVEGGFKKLTIDAIDAKRSINSKGGKRGPIKELLIYNY